MQKYLSVRSALSGVSLVWRALTWSFTGYSQPAPTRAKRSVLRRYGFGTGTWVETGTYFGKTAKWLSTFATYVITIELEPSLARRAKKKLSIRPNIRTIEGYSEVVLPTILPELSGDVSFWLDGHYSGGVTAEGNQITPISSELRIIELHLGRFSGVRVFVDDFRLFTSGKENASNSYPSRSSLVEWAERNKLCWTVEHDVFVASTGPLP